SSSELQRLEQELIRQRDKVLRTSAEFADLAGHLDAKIGGDMIDVSANAITREQASLLATREGQRLREIEEALSRLRSAPTEYGRCEICDDAIPFARLEFLPTTRRCIEHVV